MSVNVVRVKSCVNRLFDPACVPIRITINKFYFVPKRIVSGVSVFRNGGGLGTDKSDVSLMLFDSVLHRSSSPYRIPRESCKPRHLVQPARQRPSH